jgi:hypothetical protein
MWWRRWQWQQKPSSRSQLTEQTPLLVARTDHSATVFSGNHVEWVSYLNLDPLDRRDGGWSLACTCAGPVDAWVWQGVGEVGQALARLLPQCLQTIAELAQSVSTARRAWEGWLQRRQQEEQALHIMGSRWMPTQGAREVMLAQDLRPREATLVFRQSVVEDVLAVAAPAFQEDRLPARVLGRIWYFLWRFFVVSDLENSPRDRFLSRIDVATRLFPLNVGILYEKRQRGYLLPNTAGRRFHVFLANRDGYNPDLVQDQHPFLKAVNNCSYLLDERLSMGREYLTSMHVRSYLDPRYLRLSVASLMPPLAAMYQPLACRRDATSAWVEHPRIGHAGVHDREDLHAWRAVAPGFMERGFALTRQLGMGQFGRVYEAVTFGQSHLPTRVAVKVARKDGRTWQHIPDHEVVMRIANDLAPVAHMMRQYDGGFLRRPKVPYHVLQLIDGETLDHLVGIAGHEHASKHAQRGLQQTDLEAEVSKLFTLSAGERWRGERLGHRFVAGLGFAAALDIVVSMLLWLEGVHSCGYLVNDLKNGNLMMNRRGQLKGIDLDAFAPQAAPIDQLADFLFMAMSIVMFVGAAANPLKPAQALPEALLRDRQQLAAYLNACWDLSEEERPALWALSDTVFACASGELIGDHAALRARIDDLIRVKRQLRVEELVMD